MFFYYILDLLDSALPLTITKMDVIFTMYVD
jgi:hypothetical protein